MGKTEKKGKENSEMQWYYYEATHGPKTTKIVSLHVNEEMKLYNVCTLICTLAFGLKSHGLKEGSEYKSYIVFGFLLEMNQCPRTIICRRKRPEMIFEDVVFFTCTGRQNE